MDIFARQCQVEVAVVVVVCPGQFAIVYVEQDVAIEVIQNEATGVIPI